MSVIEIEQQIRPLSREEKQQLIKEIERMLAEEEESSLKNYFTPGETIDYHGPIIEPKIASQLEEYMEREKL